MLETRSTPDVCRCVFMLWPLPRRPIARLVRLLHVYLSHARRDSSWSDTRVAKLEAVHYIRHESATLFAWQQQSS